VSEKYLMLKNYTSNFLHSVVWRAPRNKYRWSWRWWRVEG